MTKCEYCDMPGKGIVKTLLGWRQTCEYHRIIYAERIDGLRIVGGMPVGL